MDATATGEAALRPSITDILFKRKGPEAAEPAAERESKSTRALVADRNPDRRISKKEETAQKISEGFDNLSGLLSTISDKLEAGNRRGDALSESIEGLPEVLRSIPETNKAQIEFLGTISKQLDLQTVRSGELMEQFRSLPAILESIPDSQRQQAEKLSEIATLLTESSEKQASYLSGVQQAQQATVNAFQNAQNKSLNLFHKAQQKSLSTYQGSQATQARQMQELLERSQKTLTRSLIVCASIVGVAMVAVAAMFFLK